MYKLLINDMFIVNMDNFKENIDSSGELRFLVNQPLSESANASELEAKLISFKSYFEDNSIERVVVLDENDELIMETFAFSRMEQASLEFYIEGPIIINIMLL